MLSALSRSSSSSKVSLYQRVVNLRSHHQSSQEKGYWRVSNAQHQSFEDPYRTSGSKCVYRSEKCEELQSEQSLAIVVLSEQRPLEVGQIFGEGPIEVTHGVAEVIGKLLSLLIELNRTQSTSFISGESHHSQLFDFQDWNSSLDFLNQDPRVPSSATEPLETSSALGYIFVVLGVVGWAFWMMEWVPELFPSFLLNTPIDTQLI